MLVNKILLKKLLLCIVSLCPIANYYAVCISALFANEGKIIYVSFYYTFIFYYMFAIDVLRMHLVSTIDCMFSKSPHIDSMLHQPKCIIYVCTVAVKGLDASTYSN